MLCFDLALQVTLRRCRFTGLSNSGSQLAGSALLAQGSAVTLAGCTFTDVWSGSGAISVQQQVRKLDFAGFFVSSTATCGVLSCGAC
jgi:hypothetical protein